MINTFILNIPHSSYVIPDYDGFIIDRIAHEINLLTDYSTEEIFDIKGVTKLICDFSRVFCNVERFSDDKQEPMAALGMGMAYTHTDDNELLRVVSPEVRAKIYSDYYLPYHATLEKVTDEKLSDYGVARIIDCHSFAHIPFKREFDKTENSPDICIGTDAYHTPPVLQDYMESFFKDEGFTVKIDSPYSGIIVPLKFYQKDKKVESIMIELNRNLYMDDQTVNLAKVKNLNNIIKRLFSHE